MYVLSPFKHIMLISTKIRWFSLVYTKTVSWIGLSIVGSNRKIGVYLSFAFHYLSYYGTFHNKLEAFSYTCKYNHMAQYAIILTYTFNSNKHCTILQAESGWLPTSRELISIDEYALSGVDKHCQSLNTKPLHIYMSWYWCYGMYVSFEVIIPSRPPPKNIGWSTALLLGSWRTVYIIAFM